MKNFLILVLVLFSINALSEEWQEFKIPGATCGNGSDYTVYFHRGSEEKLFVELMGGGACWDFTSCFLVPHTWIYPIVNLESYSIFSDLSSKNNIFMDHSKIYFPYCTADVYAGNHIASYGPNIKVQHHGYLNIQNTFNYLVKNKIIDPDKVNELILFGASAGALGSMIHGKNIEKNFKNVHKRMMILDSPGLHWGEDFWNKFSNEELFDFNQAFKKVNVNLNFKSGNIAREVSPIFKVYNKWSLAFLFGTKDLIMSTVFGDISPDDQEKNIYSDNGIIEVSKNAKNVSLWMKDTHMHTFLLLNKSANMESDQNETAANFIKRIYDQNKK